jgi:hypothetical protein
MEAHEPAFNELGKQGEAKINEAFQEYFDYMEEVGKHNEHYFKNLADKYGEDAFMDLFEDCSFSQKIEVVSNVSFRQPDYKAGEEYPCDVYVDQWTVGTEGDSYEGYLYIPYDEVFYKIFYSL